MVESRQVEPGRLWLADDSLFPANQHVGSTNRY
jgi:hypothetical protein